MMIITISITITYILSLVTGSSIRITSRSGKLVLLIIIFAFFFFCLISLIDTGIDYPLHFF